MRRLSLFSARGQHMKRFPFGLTFGAVVIALASDGAAGNYPTHSLAQLRSQRDLATTAGYRRVCPEAPRRHFARCTTMVAIDGPHSHVRGATPPGWGAPDLESAYALPSSTNGSGQIVAVVDAYDDPNAVSDFDTYRSTYGLSSGTLLKYNQDGEQGQYPASNQGWALDESVGVDMLAAGCPLCTVILVEANGADDKDLETAVATAAKLGATVISNSYGGSGLDQSKYQITGVTIVASAADDGYGVSDPSDFPSVVSVGGTVLRRAQNSRGWTENGTGTGGCASAADKRPKWQKEKVTQCPNRMTNDVAAVASGVAVYDSYGYAGWVKIAGTSISSPLVASVFALAGNADKQNGARTLWLKKHRWFLNDVDPPGYDAPTGWGTPNGIGAF